MTKEWGGNIAGYDPRPAARQDGYEKAIKGAATRYSQIIEVLGDKQMTVREIAEEMYKRGMIRTPARQEIAPRVNEMLKAGFLDIPMTGKNIVNGKRRCSYSHVNVTVYERRKEDASGL